MDPNLIELAIKWNHIASYMHFNTNLRFSIRIFSVFSVFSVLRIVCSRDGGGGSSFAFGVAGFTVDGIARFCCIFRCLPPFFVADFTLTYNLS